MVGNQLEDSQRSPSLDFKMKTKKLNYLFILVFFILISIGMFIFDSVKENNEMELERQKYIDICESIGNNTEEKMCIFESEQGLLFQEESKKLSEPAVNIPKIMTNFVYSLILFFVIRGLLSISPDKT